MRPRIRSAALAILAAALLPTVLPGARAHGEEANAPGGGHDANEAGGTHDEHGGGHDEHDGGAHDEHDGGHDEHDGGAHDEHDGGRDEHEADRAHDEHGGHDEHGSVFTVEDFARFDVRVAVAGPDAVDVAVQLPAEVRPNGERIAHIAPRFPGIARSVSKSVGDRVEAGETLAVVESENLSSYPLKTAIAGTVIDKHIAPGEMVTPGTAAFIVADLSTVWVDIGVYQHVLDQVRTGQSVWISSGPGELETEGVVSYISPIIDQSTRTATARVVLPNPQGSWRPGLFVSATVFNPADAPVVVPRRAVQRLGGHPVVFVVEDDHFAPRAVTLGRTGRSKVEVLSGLGAGDSYADEGAALVKAELAKAGAAGHHH